MPNDHDATKRPQSRFAAGAVEIFAMPITMVDEPQAGADMLNTAVMIAQAIRDAEICAGCGDSLQNHNSVNMQCADGHGTFVAASSVEKIDPRFAAAHYGNDIYPPPVNALGEPSPGRTDFTCWARDTLERFAREAADENLLLRAENQQLRKDVAAALDAWRRCALSTVVRPAPKDPPMTLLHQAAQKAVEALKETRRVDDIGREPETHWESLRHLRRNVIAMQDAAIAALESALQQQEVPREPVAWQWRRKSDPWTLDKTFNSEVHATTPDSEVRALYASPSITPPKPEKLSLHQRSLDSLKLLVHCRDSMTVADHARARLIIEDLKDALFSPSTTQQQEAGSTAALSDGIPDAEAAIAYALKRWGYRQGTKECIAFYRGACWCVLATAPSTPESAEKDDAGGVTLPVASTCNQCGVVEPQEHRAECPTGQMERSLGAGVEQKLDRLSGEIAEIEAKLGPRAAAGQPPLEWDDQLGRAIAAGVTLPRSEPTPPRGNDGGEPA